MSMEYNNNNFHSGENTAGLGGQQNHHEQNNRQFLSFFAEEQQQIQNDETEARLLTSVEEMEESTGGRKNHLFIGVERPKDAFAGSADGATSSAFLGSPRMRQHGHRRERYRERFRHQRQKSVADNLPFLMHQMNSTRNIRRSFTFDDIELQDDLDEAKNESGVGHKKQEKKNRKISRNYSGENGQGGLKYGDDETRAIVNNAFKENIEKGVSKDQPRQNWRQRRHRGNHRRNVSSTQRFYDFLSTSDITEATTDTPNMDFGQYRKLAYDSCDTGSNNNNNNDNNNINTSIMDEETEEETEAETEVSDVETPLLTNRGRKKPNRAYFSRFLGTILSVIGARDIRRNVERFIVWTVLCFIFPVLLIAAALFYFFKNPVILFMPNEVSISWCLIFLVRQIITFHLAKCTDYIFMVLTQRTKLSIKLFKPLITLLLVQANGWPLVLISWGVLNIFLLQGRHPFMKNWLFFLHIPLFSSTCEHDYDVNVTHPSCNPDNGILQSTFYLRVLFSMIIVGLVTAAKSTALALYFGRRMLHHYRPQLAKLLYDMELIAEVAELAAETEKEGFDSYLSSQIIAGKKTVQKANFIQRVPTFSPAGKKQRHSDDSDASDDDDGKQKRSRFDTFLKDDNDDDDEINKNDNMNYETVRMSNSSVDQSGNYSFRSKKHWEELKSQVKQEKKLNRIDDATTSVERNCAPDDVASRLKKIREVRQVAIMENSWTGVEKIMSQLEAWEEPVNSHSKKDFHSIYDILQFQQAYRFIQKEYPFSPLFGPADTKKACVKSSIQIYKQLLKYMPTCTTQAQAETETSSSSSSVTPVTPAGSSSTIQTQWSFSSTSAAPVTPSAAPATPSGLPFSVIGALAYNEDGKILQKRGRALLRIFSPDKDDRLSEIAFVQSIDYVYKTLRFLRASLLNTGKIDSVLEEMFNVLFYFIMLVIVTSLLGWNPWPLLVSFSTLMVSFAFAFGPSAAKYIEGVLHIAIRRPYDIGDRITVEHVESIDPVVGPEVGNTWFVQDISLTTTTLVFATSNEVSTVNNYSLTNSRIVNCSRSPKAIVTVLIKFMINKASKSKLELFRSHVEVYLKDRPRSWGTQGIFHLRTNSVSIDDGYVEYKLRAQHEKSWQESAHILIEKGKLSRYCAEIANKLGIAYTSADSPFTQIQVHMKQD